MKDDHAALVESLATLGREVEVRFTGAFADNLVNALDAATTRLTEAEAEIARLREALDRADVEAAEAEDILGRWRNSRSTSALLCVQGVRRAITEGNQSHE